MTVYHSRLQLWQYDYRRRLLGRRGVAACTLVFLIFGCILLLRGPHVVSWLAAFTVKSRPVTTGNQLPENTARDALPTRHWSGTVHQVALGDKELPNENPHASSHRADGSNSKTPTSNATARPSTDGAPRGNESIIDETLFEEIQDQPSWLMNRSLNETKRLVLTTTNFGFMDFTWNWLKSIKKTGTSPNLVILAEDKASYRALCESEDFPELLLIQPKSSNLPEEGKAIDFGTLEYVNFINRRPRYVLSFLKRGFEVFFTDVDTYWFRDPFPYFEGDFDMVMSRDSPYSLVYNAGSLYYKPTERTMMFLKHWIWRLETQTQTKPKNDQQVMNEIIRSKHVPNLKIKQLKDANFPNARLYVKHNQKCFDTSSAVVFHAAYLAGHANKMKMMAQCQMWLQ